MRDAEQYHITLANGSAEIAGYGAHGPITYLVNRLAPPQQEQSFAAMQNLGLSQTERYLDGELIGYMRHTSNIQPSNYTRSYSTAYLADASSNLHLLLETEVAKININNDTRATGVTLRDGTVITANKEVVLSAGKIQSAQLLELSGIGQKDVLAAAGVTQKVELPGVGENLQDHVRIVNAYQLRDNYTTPDILRLNATYAAEKLALWQQNQAGLYDSTSSSYAYMQWDAVLNDTSSLLASANASADKSNAIDMRKLQNLEDTSKLVPQAEVLF